MMNDLQFSNLIQSCIGWQSPTYLIPHSILLLSMEAGCQVAEHYGDIGILLKPLLVDHELLYHDLEDGLTVMDVSSGSRSVILGRDIMVCIVLLRLVYIFYLQRQHRASTFSLSVDRQFLLIEFDRKQVERFSASSNYSIISLNNGWGWVISCILYQSICCRTVWNIQHLTGDKLAFYWLRGKYSTNHRIFPNIIVLLGIQFEEMKMENPVCIKKTTGSKTN